MDNENEYITITQVAKELGWNKATVYDWIKTLELKKHRFVRNKNTFLHVDDFERLKEIKAKPWTAGPNTARTTRGRPEKPIEPHALLPMVETTEDVSDRTKRDYTMPKGDIPEDLPEGTIFHHEFYKQYGINRKTFEEWVEKGYVQVIPRTKQNRPKETDKFMTPENQAHALEWMRANKPKYLQNE